MLFDLSLGLLLVFVRVTWNKFKRNTQNLFSQGRDHLQLYEGGGRWKVSINKRFLLTLVRLFGFQSKRNHTLPSWAQRLLTSLIQRDTNYLLFFSLSLCFLLFPFQKRISLVMFFLSPIESAFQNCSRSVKNSVDFLFFYYFFIYVSLSIRTPSLYR